MFQAALAKATEPYGGIDQGQMNAMLKQHHLTSADWARVQQDKRRAEKEAARSRFDRWFFG